MLAELIAGEPATKSQTDAEVLAWLREPVSAYRVLTPPDLIKFAASNGRLAKLRDEARSTLTSDRESRSLAEAALLVVTGGTGATLDLNDPTEMALLDALATHDIWDATADVAALKTWAATSHPRWQGQKTVREDVDDISWLKHIAEARA